MSMSEPTSASLGWVRRRVSFLLCSFFVSLCCLVATPRAVSLLSVFPTAPSVSARICSSCRTTAPHSLRAHTTTICQSRIPVSSRSNCPGEREKEEKQTQTAFWPQSGTRTVSFALAPLSRAPVCLCVFLSRVPSTLFCVTSFCSFQILFEGDHERQVALRHLQLLVHRRRRNARRKGKHGHELGR